MADHRQCPSCGRQVSDEFQFCPFDATPLIKKCPSCGRTWDIGFQFCPYDYTSFADSPARVGPGAGARLSADGAEDDLRRPQPSQQTSAQRQQAAAEPLPGGPLLAGAASIRQAEVPPQAWSAA